MKILRAIVIRHWKDSIICDIKLENMSNRLIQFHLVTLLLYLLLIYMTQNKAKYPL